MSDFDYVSEMAKVQRERITEEAIRALDTPQMVDAIHALEDRIETLEAERDAHWPQVLIKCADLEAENKALRRDIDNIKVRSYELGQRELHDMALAALTKEEEL